MDVTKLNFNEIGLPLYGEKLHLYPDNWLFSCLGGWSLLFAVISVLLAVALTFIHNR